MSAFRLRSNRRVLGALLLILCASASACSSGGDKATTDTVASAAVVPTPGSSDSMSAMKHVKPSDNIQGMSNMTGDADHDFLRMMSDHHKGMIAMAHMTKDRKDAGGAKADARKIDAAQDKEIDRMVTMLEKDYKDAYAPKVLPESQTMSDMLKDKKGTGYERAFYENTIKHHQAAITMVDEYLPRGKSAAIKQMAEKMKADQTKEIAEFQKKIGQLK